MRPDVAESVCVKSVLVSRGIEAHAQIVHAHGGIGQNADVLAVLCFEAIERDPIANAQQVVAADAAQKLPDAHGRGAVVVQAHIAVCALAISGGHMQIGRAKGCTGCHSVLVDDARNFIGQHGARFQSAAVERLAQLDTALQRVTQNSLFQR